MPGNNSVGTTAERIKKGKVAYIFKEVQEVSKIILIKVYEELHIHIPQNCVPFVIKGAEAVNISKKQARISFVSLLSLSC
jgi:hypothetical protein